MSEKMPEEIMNALKVLFAAGRLNRRVAKICRDLCISRQQFYKLKWRSDLEGEAD